MQHVLHEDQVKRRIRERQRLGIGALKLEARARQARPPCVLREIDADRRPGAPREPIRAGAAALAKVEDPCRAGQLQTEAREDRLLVETDVQVHAGTATASSASPWPTRSRASSNSRRASHAGAFSRRGMRPPSVRLE